MGDRPDGAPVDQGATEIRLGGMLGATVGYAIGVRFWAGGAIDGGLVLLHDLLPVGIGLRLGGSGYLALTGGVGVEGMTAIGAALRLPVEMRLEVDLSDAVRVLAGVRVAWLFGNDTLAAHARDLRAVDEAYAMLGLRVGSREDSRSSGYFIAMTASEQYGARMLGVLVGAAMSAAGGE